MTDTATAPETPAPAAAEQPSNTFLFAIPNTDKQMQIDRTAIPAELRLELLDKAIEAYVRNSVNVANVRANKEAEPWTAYNEAQKADSLQTAVPRPEGEEPTEEARVTMLIETATAARERLYKNEVQRRDGSGKSKAPKVDPLTKLVTDAVVREVFDKAREADKSYKWPTAVKAVGGDGIKYLEAKIAERVAAGASEADLRKFMDSRYIAPAKLMLGQTDTKATKGESLL